MVMNPVYQFKDTTRTGVYRVPNDAIVLIKDDGTGNIKQVLKIANTGLINTSSIADFLADETLYIELNKNIDGGPFV